MKTIKILLSLIVIISCTEKRKTPYEWIREQILQEAQKHPRAMLYADRKIKCILKYSMKYNQNYKMVTRINRIESHFKHTAYNAKSKARGLMQVTPLWESALWRIDNGELGRHINKKGITNYNKYYYQIEYGIELGCYALKNCIRIKKGNLTNGILMYGGFFSKDADMSRGIKYLNFILDY